MIDRKNLYSDEMVARWSQQLKNGLVTQAQIRARSGISQTQLSKRLRDYNAVLNHE